MSNNRPSDLDEHIARLVDEAPSWEELPADSRNTLLRIFGAAMSRTDNSGRRSA